MRDKESSYIPALNRNWLTPAYDWVLKNLFREQAFKAALMHEAQFSGDERVLDIGCGTGTLTIDIARVCSRGHVVGLDGDQDILMRARSKAEQAGVQIQFDRGLSSALPYSDASFDRVTSSLMLHHLTCADKLRTFQEVRRVLRPGGQLHIADFGKAKGAYAAVVSRLVTIHFEQTRENLQGEITDMLQRAGFINLVEGKSFGTILGTLRLVHGTTPSSE